jgi:hypothetical protein
MKDEMRGFTEIVIGCLIIATLASGTIIYVAASTPYNPPSPPLPGNFIIQSHQQLSDGSTTYLLAWQGENATVNTEGERAYTLNVSNMQNYTVNVYGIGETFYVNNTSLMTLHP